MQTLSLVAVAGAAIVASAVTIPTVTLNNGVKMPLISLGTWQYNSSVAEDVVKLGLKVGYNHIDTARSYKNQDGVGRAVAGFPRDSYFMTTKVQSADSASVAYSQTSGYLQNDLDLLKVDHVDLVLIHYPPQGLQCQIMQEQWRALEDFYAAGKAKAIGVSNYCQSSFECILPKAKIVPAVNQVQYHVGMSSDPSGIKSYCDAKKIVLQAYSPLGDGTTELITGDLVTGIGKAHSKSGAQAALRWIVQNGVPLSTKSTSESHLQANLDIFDWRLSDAEMTKLSAATTPSGSFSFMCKKAAEEAVVV